MIAAVPKERAEGEPRAAATPESVQALARAGLEVVVERGLGAGSGFADNEYEAAGARLVDSPEACLRDAGVVLRVKGAPEDQVAMTPRGSWQVGFLDPFNNPGEARRLAEAGVTAVSMELMPRTTIAQKMDALSSQHSLSGYYMVVLAAERLGKALPMMVTPSGTIQPARVFIIGAGVAGLQAIATAKRLGARVEAFDTRPAVKEQVQSLGAKFLEVDLGETGETAGGYAKALTEHQKARQAEATAGAIAQSDIVITTAQLFGRPAPRVITRDMLKGMRPGAVVVDYAAASGGNVEGSEPDREIEVEGVRVIGFSNFAGRIARDASRMYANNVAAFVTRFYREPAEPDGPSEPRAAADTDAEAVGGEAAPGGMSQSWDDEILAGCVVTRGGEIVHPLVKERLGAAGHGSTASAPAGGVSGGGTQTGQGGDA